MQSISDIENDVLRLRLKDIKSAFHQAELAGGEKENNFCIPIDLFNELKEIDFTNYYADTVHSMFMVCVSTI